MDFRDGGYESFVGVPIDYCSLEHEHLGKKLVGGDFKGFVYEENSIDLRDVAKNKHFLVNYCVIDDLVPDEVVQDSFVGEHENVSSNPFAVDDLFTEIGEKGECFSDSFF